MFSKGDIVVCVDKGPFELTIGKKYIVVDYKDNGYVYVEPDINITTKKVGEFFENRFIKLEDWREQQIDKVLE
jgi:hypothetical protein